MLDDLLKNVLAARDELLKYEIEANTVVLNGKKFRKLIKPGFKPTIFGMDVYFDENLPLDCDLMVQYNPPKLKEPQTNADRIRSMTDEELAKWFGTRGHACPERWKACNIGIVDHEDDCIPCWLEWLKEEAKDEL